ncbi:uncharacterized protein F5Z01DRAFT_343198 [Emericellopsis atlantica]|uniref:Ubiquitin-like protease family profile domain-containing protein n=1 Tax=Emericellopsis atlantica TaxID=2614577 RepID=A0A9P7ZET7_9HYPO|nr:uncharacterized protein F5Z01DRAFT_343198 [Emericellopsis atlantica]KAG9250834.1 hypothetical protein F5Z01DRAFT_343198 [Emericellopsis atlantica]
MRSLWESGGLLRQAVEDAERPGKDQRFTLSMASSVLERLKARRVCPQPSQDNEDTLPMEETQVCEVGLHPVPPLPDEHSFLDASRSVVGAEETRTITPVRGSPQRALEEADEDSDASSLSYDDMGGYGGPESDFSLHEDEDDGYALRPIPEGEPDRKRPKLSEVEKSVREQLESPTACLTSSAISKVCTDLGLDKHGMRIADSLWFQMPSDDGLSSMSTLRHIDAGSIAHLLAPIYHPKRSHWSLLSVEMTEHQIFARHYDPLPHRASHDEVHSALLAWLRSQEDTRLVDFASLDGPRQYDAHNCGVYVVCAMNHIVHRKMRLPEVLDPQGERQAWLRLSVDNNNNNNDSTNAKVGCEPQDLSSRMADHKASAWLQDQRKVRTDGAAIPIETQASSPLGAIDGASSSLAGRSIALNLLELPAATLDAEMIAVQKIREDTLSALEDAEMQLSKGKSKLAHYRECRDTILEQHAHDESLTMYDESLNSMLPGLGQQLSEDESRPLLRNLGLARWIEENRKQREIVHGELRHCTERSVAKCEKEVSDHTARVNSLRQKPQDLDDRVAVLQACKVLRSEAGRAAAQALHHEMLQKLRDSGEEQAGAAVG